MKDVIGGINDMKITKMVGGKLHLYSIFRKLKWTKHNTSIISEIATQNVISKLWIS